MPNPRTAAEWASKLVPEHPAEEWGETERLIITALELYARQQAEAFRERAAKLCDATADQVLLEVAVEDQHGAFAMADKWRAEADALKKAATAIRALPHD